MKALYFLHFFIDCFFKAQKRGQFFLIFFHLWLIVWFTTWLIDLMVLDIGDL